MVSIARNHTHTQSYPGGLMGEIKRAFARQNQERPRTKEEQKRMTDRSASTLTIAVSIIASLVSRLHSRTLVKYYFQNHFAGPPVWRLTARGFFSSTWTTNAAHPV